MGAGANPNRNGCHYFAAVGAVHALCATVVESSMTCNSVPRGQLCSGRTLSMEHLSGIRLACSQQVEGITTEGVRRRHREARRNEHAQ